MMRIGEVVATLEISADTLRYYEKIKLVPEVHRNDAGVRLYFDKDLHDCALSSGRKRWDLA